MIAASGVLLLMVFVAALALLRGRSRDLFHPLRVSAVLSTLTTVPYLLWSGLTDGQEAFRFTKTIAGLDLSDAVLKYALIHVVYFLSLAAGILGSTRLAVAVARTAPGFKAREGRLSRVGWIAIALGGAAFALFLVQIGGLGVLLYNLDKRVELQAGNGYVLRLMTLLTVGAVLLTAGLRANSRHSGKALLGAAVLLAAVLFSSLGGRKEALHLVITVGIAYHYCVARFDGVPWRKLTLLALIVVPYFIAVPILRSTDGIQNALDGGAKGLVDQIARSSDLAITQSSYVDTYAFIGTYFEPSNIWLGSSYLDLLTAPIPRGMFPDKPPVDEGKYIRTLMDGQHVVPPMPSDDLFYSSAPPETMGVMFANFWFPGLILGGILMGFVLRFGYAYLSLNPGSPFAVFIYAQLLLNFQLTNLRLAQFLSVLVLVAVFFAFAFGVRRLRTARFNRPVGLAAR